ncbi:MAG: hypothetical protein WCT10_01485 [Patescibacteria group bacterium]|jgi:hypothetical protein
MKHHFLAPSLLLIGLVLAGAGCAGAADELAGDALKPTAVPLSALNLAKQLTAQEQARANAEADSIANEMTVAMVITENAAVPPGIEPGATFGCSDRSAYTKVARESDSGDVLRDALQSLFAVRDTNYDGLYNSLASSSLAVDKIQSRDGVTTEVWLKGQIVSSGTCDDPRIKEQIEATVRRLKPDFKIFLNGSEKNYRCIGNQSGDCAQPK